MQINTTLVGLADAQRLCDAVEGCGVAVPRSLLAVLRAAETLAGAPSITDPTRDLVRAALDGHSSADQVNKALEKAAIQRLVVQERAGLAQRVEGPLVQEFGARLDDDAANELLGALRGTFDDASLALRDALDIVDIGIDPTEFLQAASAEELAAFQRLGPCVTVLDRLASVVSVLGPLGSFPVVPDPRDTDPAMQVGWLHDTAVLCCSGGLMQACREFQKPRPFGDVRSSPWLRVPAFLHSVESARERLRAWCENAWAAEEAERPRSGRLINHEMVDDLPRANPFALEEAKQR